MEKLLVKTQKYNLKILNVNVDIKSTKSVVSKRKQERDVSKFIICYTLLNVRNFVRIFGCNFHFLLSLGNNELEIIFSTITFRAYKLKFFETFTKGSSIHLAKLCRLYYDCFRAYAKKHSLKKLLNFCLIFLLLKKTMILS